MQEILIFIILIGVGAFYLFGQVQPEIANLFGATAFQATQSSKSPAPSAKVAQKQIAKTPIYQTQQVGKKPAVSAVKPEPKIISYVDKVQISNIRPQTLTSPSLITLYATNLQKDEKINPVRDSSLNGVNITGWEIKTKKGSFLIPKGLEQINPLFPALPSQDIIIKQGDIIYISSDPSPFLERDKNFRPNKCLGYLSSSRNFTIPLPQTCPRPDSSKLPSNLSYWCQQYINSLGSCQAPTDKGLEKYELLKDEVCMSYLNSNLNYGSCFLNYQKDQDFSSREWHIYLDYRDKEIFYYTQEFDTLYLRDENGLLVDKYDFGQRVCCD